MVTPLPPTGGSRDESTGVGDALRLFEELLWLLPLSVLIGALCIVVPNLINRTLSNASFYAATLTLLRAPGTIAGVLVLTALLMIPVAIAFGYLYRRRWFWYGSLLFAAPLYVVASQANNTALVVGMIGQFALFYLVAKFGAKALRVEPKPQILLPASNLTGWHAVARIGGAVGCAVALTALLILAFNVTFGSRSVDIRFLGPFAFVCVVLALSFCVYFSIGAKPNAEPRGLAGWLLLVPVGLAIGAVRMSVAASTTVISFYSDEAWSELTSAPVYHPLLVPLVAFELLACVLFAMASVALLYLFVRKDRRFPRAFVLYLLFGVAYFVVDRLVGGFVPVAAEMLNTRSSWIELAVSVAVAAIWIPYTTESKRVKNTFTKGQLGLLENSNESG